MELLPLVVFALLQARDVRHAELGERFLESAQTSSVIRRIERFFDRHPLCPADVARVVLTLLPSTRPREFILDRTNWKHGHEDVNVLLLAVLWRGVASPLLFELLPHRGSSDTNLRHTLMDDALCLLKPSEIQVLYADRESLGHVWIQGLARRGIPICVRLRSDTLVDKWPAREWLQDLKPADPGLWVEEVEVCGHRVDVTLTSTQDGEALMFASNAGSVTKIQAGYLKRFRTECLFRALKTKGFKLESTHMTLHDHVPALPAHPDIRVVRPGMSTETSRSPCVECRDARTAHLDAVNQPRG